MPNESALLLGARGPAGLPAPRSPTYNSQSKRLYVFLRTGKARILHGLRSAVSAPDLRNVRVSRKKLHSLRWARFREGGDEQLKDSRDVLRDKLRARVDKRLADNRTAGKHNGHELCMVEMSRPCKIKKSSRIARVVTCKSCWDFGTEKSVTSKPCAGKPNGSSYTKREWWKRQRLEWPRNVKCLLAVWDVDLKKVDDVYRYSS